MTNFYVQLTYEQYKRLEEFIKDFNNVETTHESTNLDDKFYHKSLRLPLGDVMLEAHGPLVRP